MLKTNKGFASPPVSKSKYRTSVPEIHSMFAVQSFFSQPGLFQSIIQRMRGGEGRGELWTPLLENWKKARVDENE